MLCVLGLLAWFGGGLVLHDVFVFSAFRAKMDQQLSRAVDAERHPNAPVREAFNLDDPYLVSLAALNLYRDYWWLTPEEERPNFHSFKLVAVPILALQLRVWYSLAEIETHSMQEGCADARFWMGTCNDLSKRIFGRSLNDISAKQLACIRAYYRSRQKRSCPELAALTSRAPP